VAGDGAAGLAAPSRAEASPAADTGTATPVEKPAKASKPAEDRIKAITPEMLPEALKPFADQLAEFWKSKRGKKTPQSLGLLLSNAQVILTEGGSSQLLKQFDRARDSAINGNAWMGMNLERWRSFRGTGWQQPAWTPGQPIAEPSMPMAKPEPKPERLPGRNPGVDPLRILREQQARMQQQRMELEADHHASGPQEPQEGP
jgi:hypothetical protein